MIADRGQLQAGEAQGFDRRLIKKPGLRQRRSTDQVASRDSDAIGVAGTETLELAGELRRAARMGIYVHPVRAGDWDRALRRLKVPMEVIDGQDLHFDRCGRDRGRWRRRAGA